MGKHAFMGDRIRDDVFAEIGFVVLQLFDEDIAVENVDPHRSQHLVLRFK